MASMESLEKNDWPTPPSCAPDLPRTRSCGGKSKESPWEGGQVWHGPRAGDRARSGSGPVPAISRILREACPSEASFIMGTPYWSWGRSWEVCPGGGRGKPLPYSEATVERTGLEDTRPWNRYKSLGILRGMAKNAMNP